MDTERNEFQGRNLAIYFLIVFGLQAFSYGLLIAGVLKMPSVEGPGALIDDPRLVVLTLAAWGPIIAAFVITALNEGKPAHEPCGGASGTET